MHARSVKPGKKESEDCTMKKELLTVKTRNQAIKAAPWAARIIKVDGGYLAFESVADYRIWLKQR